MNKVYLIGRLVAEPQTIIRNDKKLCTFSIAVNPDKNTVNFYNIAVWGMQGQLCINQLSKGSKVAISGNQKINNYQVENVKKMSVEVTADTVDFLSRKKAQ